MSSPPSRPTRRVSPSVLTSVFVLGLLCAVSCRNAGPVVTRLTARPSPPTTPLAPGAHALGLGTAVYRGQLRDGALYVPTRAAHSSVPLVVLLHGGGGKAADFEFAFPIAEEYGVSLLTLDARHNTWDGVDSPFGPDVLFIDQALRHTFARVPVDPARLALAGLSDGGMYALTIGRINGDLFTHLAAVAPGYLQEPAPPRGRPRVFLAHGTRDTVYRAAGSRTRLLPLLKAAGHDVRYFEFDGPHFITPPAFRAMLAWLTR